MDPSQGGESFRDFTKNESVNWGDLATEKADRYGLCDEAFHAYMISRSPLGKAPYSGQANVF
jgi:hypothetical protein